MLNVRLLIYITSLTCVLGANLISSHSCVDSVVHRSCVYLKGIDGACDIWVYLTLDCLLSILVVSFFSTNLPTPNEQEIKL